MHVSERQGEGVSPRPQFRCQLAQNGGAQAPLPVDLCYCYCYVGPD